MNERLLRSQVQLTRQQREAIQALAVKEGVSIAEIVRRAVDAYSSRATGDTGGTLVRKRAAAVVGRYASGSANGSDDHDRLAAESFLE